MQNGNKKPTERPEKSCEAVIWPGFQTPDSFQKSRRPEAATDTPEPGAAVQRQCEPEVRARLTKTAFSSVSPGLPDRWQAHGRLTVATLMDFLPGQRGRSKCSC